LEEARLAQLKASERRKSSRSTIDNLQQQRNNNLNNKLELNQIQKPRVGHRKTHGSGKIKL
jgi:hypothetical protein